MFKTAKVVGLNSDLTAALALISTGEASATLRSEQSGPQPQLFIIITCQTEDAFSRIRQCLCEAETCFYSSASAVPQKLAETLDEIQKTLKDTEGLEILLAACQEDLSGNVLYLLCREGPIGAYLIRGDKHTNLCPSASTYQLVSGILQDGDRVVLATDSLINLLGGDIETLGKFPIAGLEDEVGSRLPFAENYPVAAIVLEREKTALEPIKGKNREEAEEFFLKTSILGFVKPLVFKTIPRSKRSVVGLGVLLMLFILAGTVFTYRQKKEADLLDQFNRNYQSASAEYQRAQSLKDLDPATALVSLEKARQFLAEALKIRPGGSDALELKKQLEQGGGEVLKSYQVDNFPLWLDLDLVKKEFSADRISLSRGKVLLLDTSKRSLVQVDIKTKSHQILAGDEKLGRAGSASLNGDVAWVYSEDKGIIQIDTKSGQAKAVVKSDEQWGEIKQIFGFAGNAYLLDSSNNQIWKYLPVEKGYSDKREYFKEGIKVDLSSSQIFQIDSSVWILKKGGEILKYTQGSPDYFSIGGLDKGTSDPKSIYVSDDTDNLYILDSGNNRLVVLDKKGVYQAQYQSDKFGSFTDLVVDEKGKKVYLLAGGKIFVMELK